MTNTTVTQILNPTCDICGQPSSRRRDLARHTARKHPVVPTALRDLVPGVDLVEWAGVRREVTDVQLNRRHPVLVLGATFRVTVPAASFKARKVCR